MKNLLKKLLGKKEVKLEVAKETFSNVEMREVVKAWSEAVEENKKVEKILVVNNLMFASKRRGDIVDVEWYENQTIKGYKEKIVGGVFPVPTSVEDLQDSNILYVPYFE